MPNSKAWKAPEANGCSATRAGQADVATLSFGSKVKLEREALGNATGGSNPLPPAKPI